MVTRIAQTPLQKQIMPESSPSSSDGSAPADSSADPTAAEPTAPVQVPDFNLESFLAEFVAGAQSFIEALATPWALIQLLVVLVCFGIAHLITRVVTPPLEERLRRLEEQPQLMRVLIVPLRRLTWILFALFVWLAAYMMREVTWPSRGYYVGVAASLAMAGAIISVTSRFIRNRTLANIFFYVAWAIAALQIIGLSNQTFAALDAVAFSLGNFRISLLATIKAVLFMTVLMWLATIIGNFAERRLRQNEDVAPALQVLLAKFIKFALLTIAVLATISVVGIDLTALTIFSGALGLGIGFGLQKVASNLISGIIILSDRSIKPGDVITLGSTFGWINALKSRYVSVITRDGVEYLIPNEQFVSEQVVNWSYSNQNVRQEIKFGTSYDAYPYKVREIAIEAISGLERVLERPSPVCHVTGFGDSSVDYVLRFWIRDPKNGLANIRGNAFLALWDAFKEHDIEIPYPHRQLIFPDGAEIKTTAARKPRRPAAKRKTPQRKRD